MMKKTTITQNTHQNCPSCGHKDCLTEFSNGNTFCHSCGHTTVTGSNVEYLSIFKEHRKVPVSVQKFYNSQTIVDKKNNYAGRVYNYPHRPKFRWGDKDFTKNSGFTNDHLFGMDKFNSGSKTTITIVEGEEDALAAYYMLGSKEAVVALPGSSVSHNLLKNCKEYLDSFKSIVLVPDNDDAGQKIIEPFTTLFPNRVYVVKLDKHKDPCDFLSNGDEKDFLWAWRNRQKCVPPNIYNTEEQFEEILADKTINSYIETPCEFLNDTIKGLMTGHLYLVTGKEGQGKTEVLRYLKHHILKNHSHINVASSFMEESKQNSLKTLACYELGENVRDPETKVDDKDILKSVKNLLHNNQLYLFDLTEDQDPLILLEKIRYLATACNVKYFFIDPIQQLAYDSNNVMSVEQTLTKLIVKLENLVTDLDICVVISSHVNDEGETRSCRMIGKSCSVRLDLERDHMNVDEDIRNTTKVFCSKNRPTSKTGLAGILKFNLDTFTITEET
jgi:twinkle protein